MPSNALDICTMSFKPDDNSMLEALAFIFIDGNQLREVKLLAEGHTASEDRMKMQARLLVQHQSFLTDTTLGESGGDLALLLVYSRMETG